MTIPIEQFAKSYLNAGLCVLPADAKVKHTTLRSWTEFQTRLPTAKEVEQTRWRGVCLICGAISGNLELLDFDYQGEWYDVWSQRIPGELFAKLVVESSQSGGRHVVYRCEVPVSGSCKVASKRVEVPSGEKVSYKGSKTELTPELIDGKWYIFPCMIETRGEAGLFLCHPSPGYELIQGDIAELPVLTSEERETLLSAAYSLQEKLPKTENILKPRGVSRDELRPGDEYNDRGDMEWILRKHGWELWKDGENQYWTRPGKSSGCSATLKDRVFFCFSSNANPFENGKAYAPFSVYAMLEHGGDFAAAATALKQQGYGNQQSILSTEPVPIESGPTDPGPFPDELLAVPGFVGDVMRWNLTCAKRKQPVLALAGALSLLSVLTGRKIRDSWGTRTNLYCLGVCGASRGKDQARQCNKAILLNAGLEKAEREGMASATGLVNAIEAKPATLFQLDEIGRMLQTLGDGKRNPHLYNIVTVLMRMYTSADSHFVTDVYADTDKSRIIDQPHCVVYGTTVPKSLYEGLTPESISDGFMSRLLIFEGTDDARIEKPEASTGDPPAELVEVAKYWGDYRPDGNLGDQHPEPTCVPYTDEAAELMSRFVVTCDDRLLSESNGTAELWGRAIEKAHKLALLYSCSLPGFLECPQIAQDAAQWAIDVTEYLTVRMIYLASQWVAEGRYEQMRNRLYRTIDTAGPKGINKSAAMKSIKAVKLKDRDEMLEDLIAMGYVTYVELQTGGRPAMRLKSNRYA